MSILRELFGPSKEVIWNQLAQETGAIHTSGGFLKKSKVEASHGEWTITLDTHTVRSRRSSRYTTTNYTRFRAPYVNADNFFFTVYPEGFLASIGKSLGLVQDVIVGHDELDHNFVIQGNYCWIRKTFSLQYRTMKAGLAKTIRIIQTCLNLKHMESSKM